MSKLESRMRAAKAAGKTYKEVAKLCDVPVHEVHRTLSIKRKRGAGDACAKCGVSRAEATIHAHHDNYITNAYRLLCSVCHASEHHGYSETMRHSCAGKPLTTREVQVRDFVLEGLKNWQIAEKLIISIKTVEKHRTKLYYKLRVNSMSGLFKACRNVVL